MSPRWRIATRGACDDLLTFLANTLDLVDPTAQADIVIWTPQAAASAPMPFGPALNVLDVRGQGPGPTHPAAGLLLVDTAGWPTGTPVAIVERPLTAAAAPSADFQSLHILIDRQGPLDLARQAAAWAAAQGIACGAVAPAGPGGLALTEAIGAAPALAPGALLLDLREDAPAPGDTMLDALALGAPLLYFDETPFRARLAQAGAARRIEQIADLEALGPDQRRALSRAALAYVRDHHDAARIAAALRESLASALARWRRLLADWPARGPGTHVLVISDEALNLIDIRVHLPFAALLRRGAISGYSLLRHGDFAFSTVPVTPDLRFGAVWVQRSTDPLVQLLLRALHQPFVYDLDDLLTVSPSYREEFAAEAIEVARDLVRDCATLSCATPRLAERLAPAKAAITPNLADGEPHRVAGRARTLVWASSDQPALTVSAPEIERAVRDFCRAHQLELLCIGAPPPASFAGLPLEHVRLLSYEAYLARLRAAAPGILVGPLETCADPDTQHFIDAKSDIKIVEARRTGLVGVFSRATPYRDSDLAPPILCDNDYRSWLAGLERARQACEQPSPAAPWPERRAADRLGPAPWADALLRAPADLSAGAVADAIRLVRAQGETLLTAPELFDEQDYLRRHDDVRDAVRGGTIASGYRHYVQSGFREGRAARRLPSPNQAGEFWWARLLHATSRLEAEIAARAPEIEALRDRAALRRTLPSAPDTVTAPPDAMPWHPAAELAGPCPVCDAPGPHPALLTMLDHTLGRCAKCGTCFYADRVPYLYENEAEAAVLLQLYLEQNAGIHQQTSLLFAQDDVDSVLDIGCGFGFTVDLAASVLGWRAVGLDPSAMGAAGAAALGADIRQAYLTPEIDIGGKFALVIASEVIEHVPDPYPFLALLRDAMAPAGTLVLTTPDAGALEPGIGPARALCIAAPRVHLILFDRASLTLALQRAGFRHVQVTAQHDSLLAFASDRPLRPRQSAAAAHLAAYRTYLERLLDRAEPGSALWNGAAGRLFALLLPSAPATLLHALFARIAEAWRPRFGIDLARLRLPDLLGDAERAATTAAALAARQPLNMPGVLLNRALLEWQTPGRTPERVLEFARSAHLHALQTGRILQAANMIDHDLRQTAIRARMLILDCLAELAPELEAELVRGLAEPSPGPLAEWLDPAPDLLVPRLAACFIRLVGAGCLDDAARLEPWMADPDQLCRTLADQSEALLRSLFSLGQFRLARGNAAAALTAFERMATQARRRIEHVGRPSPARDFLRVAEEHMELAAARLHREHLPT